MKKIRNYHQLAKDILVAVGNEQNIVSFTRCATRLRLVLKEVPLDAESKIKQMPGVITVVQSGGQFQVVIGTHVSDVYEALSGIVDEKLIDSDHKIRIVDAVIGSMSAIFAPIVFVLAAAGLLQGILIITKYFYPEVTSLGTFAIFNFMSWTPFVFLPVFIAITAAKHFNCSPFIAVLCSCALINPDWAAMATRIANGEEITLFGFSLAQTIYTSSVLPPIFMVWGLSYVEKYAKKIIPDVVSELFTPLVCMVIMVPVTLILIGPISNGAAVGIANGYNWLFETSPAIAAALIGGIWQVIVIFGVHWGITPVIVANFDLYGRDSFQAFQTMAVVAQMAAAFAVGFKSRNKKFKTTSFSAGVTAIFGITEPTLYGVTLRLKKPFICGCIGGAIGAVVASLFGSYYYAYAGLPGLLTIMNAISLENSSSFIGELIGVITTIVVTFGLVYIVGFEDPKEAAVTSSEHPAEGTATTKMVKDLGLSSPINGAMVSLESVNDASFAQKLLGDGVAFQPRDGQVFAPCDAVVSSVIDSQHAIGLTCRNGAELLIHVGLDTVNLKGQYFETLVTLGQEVKAGEALIKFDKAAIEEAGYDLTTPFIVLNSDEFQLDFKSYPFVQMGQPIIQMS
ncbi:beta-glucoside-specific PTS transporter subunit IIABC [Vibrio aphrogenes]|uniref:beta-glucoside-specific PTS transporter subunit IIABC n=1 Tax=Vibrio aphrogenes TaxID=1891186 RepID=UPI000B363219|nr:beta-glucoside-specific PTS transporter subunit IIABC [Vibrio aphrogenes]